jgi:hypothetical protein
LRQTSAYRLSVSSGDSVRLPETITVWTRSGNDGLGGPTWSAPVSYPARIAYRQQRFVDTSGAEQVSQAVCYSEGVELRTDALVLFAASTAAYPPTAARTVNATSQIPSGAGALKKAWFA